MAASTGSSAGDSAANPQPAFPVVAIGGAGELDALKTLLAHLPAESGMAFVVLPHAFPEKKNQLPRLLGSCTEIPVSAARQGTKIHPDQIFVLPPGKDMRLAGGKFTLRPLADIPVSAAPIDTFLRSLAKEQREQAVAVLLSGCEREGALGLKAIRESGGLVILQAQENGRDRKRSAGAIEPGLADWVLDPAAIAEKIKALAPLLRREAKAIATPQLEEAFQRILDLVNRRTGHQFSCYKTNTILRRVNRRMVILGQDDLAGYLQVLQRDDGEIQALFKDLLIGVTRFFRDPEALAVLQQNVIPELVASQGAEGPLRVWVAGCSTGEEAYSLAILLTEYLQTARERREVQIFASDLDADAVSFARTGFYPAGIAQDLSPERLARFFAAEGSGYRVCDSLREMILFAPHNIIKDPPFSRLHLISCRNLMIYLDQATQKKLMTHFHHSLLPGGYLFLGASEHLGEASGFYHVIDKRWRLFQRKETHVPRDFRLSALPPQIGLRPGKPAPAVTVERPAALGALAEKKLLRDYSPAAVVVNRELEVVHFPSETGDFLEPPLGAATLNLIKMAREELRPALRSVSYQAFQEKRKIAASGITLSHGGRQRRLQITADPLSDHQSDQDLLLIVIQEQGDSDDCASSSAPPPATASLDHNLLIQHLEEELKQRSDQLTGAMREYEATNEELMSINEELHSANEELETSREELQALNEELVTVNTELHNKNEELGRTSSDISNLIKSAHIAAVFLDREMRVRRFTAASSEIFHLIESDLGRPFHHISGQLDTTPILKGAQQVLNKLQLVEQELATADGRCFILRISPYRTLEDVIEGVVITLLDITRRKQAEEERETQRRIAENRAADAEEARRILQAIIDHVPLGLGVADRDANLVMVSRFGLDLSGLPLEEIRDNSIHDYPKLWGMRHLDGEPVTRVTELPLVRAIRKGEVCIAEEWLLERPDGHRVTASINAAPIRGKGGEITGGVVAWSDITQQRRQQVALQESEKRLKVVIENQPTMVFAADEQGHLVFWNKECERVTGYQAEEIVGNPMATERLFADGEYRRRWRAICGNTMGFHGELELVIRCKNGSHKTILWANGSCYCAIPGWALWGSAIDITERKEVEKALNDARMAAENANRAKSDFLANISHEIRTPLTIIKGAHELLAETELTPYQGQFLHMAHSSADTLLRLIEDLLDFSRIEARRMILYEAPFDLFDTVETTLAGFSMEAAKKKLPIHLDIGPDIPRCIIGDSLRLRQVLTNLLSNAVKFTDQGRLDLRIHLKKDGQPSEDGPAMLFFALRDTGIGIPVDKQGLLFQSFSQIDGSATRRYGGTGLGLAISQRIIQQMGGEIWVESQPGKGSEFFFTLPARPAEEMDMYPGPETKTSPPVSTVETHEGSPARILVAEDEAMIRHLISTVLKRKGWEVVTACDGAEAMEHLEKTSFDLVLMDIQMPQLDGVQVTRILRQRENEQGLRTPIIALTAHAGEDDRRRFLRAGMDGRITKPIQVGEFLRTIEKTLEDRGARSAAGSPD